MAAAWMTAIRTRPGVSPAITVPGAAGVASSASDRRGVR